MARETIYWTGEVPQLDDFGAPIGDVFYDAKTRRGPWGIMSHGSFVREGYSKLGPGYGQKYKRQPNGRWLKIKG